MRSSSASLRTIASAQADFRANDRDGNGRTDYWRPDLVGLYALKNEGQALKLIELSVAAADDHPLISMAEYSVPFSRAGFWYRALPHADESTRGPDRFAACAYPESIAEGRYGTYAISEKNVVHKKMLGHARGIGAHPTEAHLKAEEWETLD